MATKPPIKAVGLDVFSFLISAPRLLPSFEVASLFRDRHIGPEMIEAAANNPKKGYWIKSQRGQLSNRDRWTKILDDLELLFNGDDVEECTMLEAELVMKCRPFQGMEDTIIRLREQGLRVGVLTNATPTHLALEQILELPRLVDVFLASCRQKIDKSQDAFFLQLAGKLGFSTGEILYCDDGPDHLERAARLGFRTCRGVMGETWDRDPDEQGAAEFVIHSLPELLALVDQLT